MASYGKLVKEVVQLLDRFDPENHCDEVFIEDALKDLKNKDVSEEAFVLEVLSGCIEFKQLLDVVVDAFYARSGKNCLASGYNLYAVICYLATFKLEDLGLQQFSKIIRSQDISKMYKFLSFFFDVINLSTWIKDDWSQIYDAPYVVENWITPLLRWQPEVEPLINQLHDKITNGCSPKKMDKIWTEPQEFNLTKPKPRAIPLPEKIPLQGKHQQVPPSTYKPPKEQQLLDEMKLKNRQKAETVLLEANTEQFSCANAEKSKRTKQVISQIIKEKELKLKFQCQPANEMPASYKADNIPIRLNTTAILREGALYNRRVEQELRKIEKLVEGARDPSEFMAWQRQMRERDMEEKLAEVERRRLEGRLSHEEAVLARHKIIQENKKKATLKKEETAGLMRLYAEKRLEEEKGMKELVEQVVEGHKNARQAKAKILECKQRIVQEVTEESQELLRQALEKAEAELIRKFELIRQIRAIESVPLIRHKFVDHTQTAGHALLGEMSLVELHERLTLLKEAKRKEDEEKRDTILREKQTKEQFLLDHLNQISLHRAAMGKANMLKKEEKKAKSQSTKAFLKDEQLVELQKKLEEKRQDRRQQSESLKIKAGEDSAQRLRSWNTRKKSLEEHHWLELERNLERQVQLLKHGSMSSEVALKLATCHAARIGASSLCTTHSLSGSKTAF